MTATVGDIAQAVRALVAARAPGALLQLEPRVAAAQPPLASADAATIAETAMARVLGRLPDGTVARTDGRHSLDAVLAGERDALLVIARGLLGSLVADRALARCPWQVVLVRISDDADRALTCDASYDLAAQPGDALAWVEPYAGADWRHAGRMPTVTFEPPLVARRFT